MGNISLYKISKVNWAVKSNATAAEETYSFGTIEAAAEYLEGLGVIDEEIDYALIEMAASSNTRAQFNATSGRFELSDKERLNAPLGVA